MSAIAQRPNTGREPLHWPPCDGGSVRGLLPKVLHAVIVKLSYGAVVQRILNLVPQIRSLAEEAHQG